MINMSAAQSKYVHHVGLSATFLNYQDVTTFLWVDKSKGCTFYFDALSTVQKGWLSSGTKWQTKSAMRKSLSRL
ncbi:hypothetical protein EDD85DRAFT_556039 [Armillaria nabsnona]|nr:hypothetical protein EDD85DRAFT_556039 [Armillaria nabsnona]